MSTVKTEEVGDVTVEQHGAHVGIVCLHRPPNNYFDTALVEAVAAAYEELDASGWCRAVVLASEGRHFCAGLDFAGNAGQDIAALYRAALRLFAAPLPVVAAVQGAAIGGGCGLALSADFRVATPQTRFSANFARLGFHHGFALTVTLPAGGRPPGRSRPPAHRAARRRGGSALPRPLRPPGRGRRPPGAGPSLRGRARRLGPAGRPLHPGHASPGPGGGSPAGHGARVRRAARVARHGRLR